MILKHQGNAGFFTKERNENLEALNTEVESVISMSILDKYMIEGVYYSAHQVIEDMSVNEHAYVGITVPSGKLLVISALTDMALKGSVVLYKDSDISGGSSIDIVQHNQVAPSPSTVTFISGVTVNVAGTQIGAWTINSAAKVNKGGTHVPYEGFFAFPEGVYLIDFESLVDSNALEYNFRWGEPNAGALSSGAKLIM